MWSNIPHTSSVVPKARAGHTSVQLPTSFDQLYIFGGYDSSRNLLNDMYKYNTSTASFQLIPYKNTTPYLERRWHSCNVIGNSKLAIFGGWNAKGALSDFAIFDTGKL